MVKWTKELIIEKAKSYETRKQFIKENPSLYQKAWKMGILDELNLPVTRKWDENSIKVEAKKYKTRRGFYEGCPTAYNLAVKGKMMDMLFPKKPLLTREELAKMVKSFTYREDFKKAHPKIYNKAVKMGLFTNDMFEKKNIKWTKEIIIETASGYSSRMEFANGNRQCYEAARRAKMMDQLFANKKKPYSIIDLQNLAILHGSKSDFRKNALSAYNAAIRKGVLDKIFEF